jgi:hypothetical protein
MLMLLFDVRYPHSTKIRLRMMMNFMYADADTKTIKEADTQNKNDPPERVDEGTSKEYEL